MLEEVLKHLKNWFVVPNGIHFGQFEIKGGALALPFLLNGQYYRIVGSVFNDGLHKNGEGELQDEAFDGAIWALAIPKAVEKLAEEIKEWENKNGAVANGPYQSESFGGYTYSKATDSSSGGAVTWQSAFRGRLNLWRKI